MSEYRARIDQVLVHLFNDILRIEEESLHRGCPRPEHARDPCIAGHHGIR